MVVKLNFVEHSWLAHKNLYNMHCCHNRICTILLFYTNFCRTLMVVRQNLCNIHGSKLKFLDHSSTIFMVVKINFSLRDFTKNIMIAARWC